MGIAPPGYPKELLELLAIYPFPGNIRELQGMVFDAVTRCKSGMLSLEPFRQKISVRRFDSIQIATPPPTDQDARTRTIEEFWGHFPTLDEAENFLIDAALDRAKGNQGIAATMLGLKRQTFNMRLKTRKKGG
jgi:DNA-binding NtrC family response regulator